MFLGGQQTRQQQTSLVWPVGQIKPLWPGPPRASVPLSTCRSYLWSNGCLPTLFWVRDPPFCFHSPGEMPAIQGLSLPPQGHTWPGVKHVAHPSGDPDTLPEAWSRLHNGRGAMPTSRASQEDTCLGHMLSPRQASPLILIRGLPLACFLGPPALPFPHSPSAGCLARSPHPCRELAGRRGHTKGLLWAPFHLPDGLLCDTLGSGPHLPTQATSPSQTPGRSRTFRKARVTLHG